MLAWIVFLLRIWILGRRGGQRLASVARSVRAYRAPPRAFSLAGVGPAMSIDGEHRKIYSMLHGRHEKTKPGRAQQRGERLPSPALDTLRVLIRARRVGITLFAVHQPWRRRYQPPVGSRESPFRF
jgi:hypothetical protein